MNRTALLAIALLCFTAGAARAADAPADPPKPGPEHQKLGAFVGWWSGRGHVEPGPFGPGGYTAWSESCKWFDGGFSVVCESKGHGPSGRFKGLGVLTYDAGRSAYTYYGTDNSGYTWFAQGAIRGTSWIFTSEEKVDGKTTKSRFTLEFDSPPHQKLSWEMSEGGATWKTMMEGESSQGH